MTPRALTLGAYLDALIAAGVDDGEAWDASAAPLPACLAVLDALSESVALPPVGEAAGVTGAAGGEAFGRVIRRLASEAWGRLARERERAFALAARLRREAEEAVGEGLVAGPRPSRHKLLRTLGTLPPTERAAAAAEPLARALVLAECGALQRQVEDPKAGRPVPAPVGGSPSLN